MTNLFYKGFDQKLESWRDLPLDFDQYLGIGSSEYKGDTCCLVLKNVVWTTLKNIYGLRLNQYFTISSGLVIILHTFLINLQVWVQRKVCFWWKSLLEHRILNVKLTFANRQFLNLFFQIHFYKFPCVV